MNFSAITVSFPIDEETYEEIKGLCDLADKADLKQYQSVMNLTIAKSYESKGFFVLIYDDEKNALVGVASAVDLMGLNTYEWSILVDPMYREIGIGEALYNVLRKGLEARGSDGDLALAIDGSNFGQQFLEKKGYQYSFSEATLEAEVAVAEQDFQLVIQPYQTQNRDALCEIFSLAFGDTYEESLELIDFNSTTEGLVLWVVKRNDEIVGTVTTRKEGDSHWITALAVHPRFSGQGIGTEILMWVKDYVLRQSDSKVLLDVEIDNRRALSIYEKSGFMVVSQINYYVYVG